jgi:hypothetical protein
LWAPPELGGVRTGTVVAVVVVDNEGAEDPPTLAPGVGSKSIHP